MAVLAGVGHRLEAALAPAIVRSLPVHAEGVLVAPVGAEGALIGIATDEAVAGVSFGGARAVEASVCVDARRPRVARVRCAAGDDDALVDVGASHAIAIEPARASAQEAPRRVRAARVIEAVVRPLRALVNLVARGRRLPEAGAAGALPAHEVRQARARAACGAAARGAALGAIGVTCSAHARVVVRSPRAARIARALPQEGREETAREAVGVRSPPAGGARTVAPPARAERVAFEEAVGARGEALPTCTADAVLAEPIRRRCLIRRHAAGAVA